MTQPKVRGVRLTGKPRLGGEYITRKLILVVGYRAGAAAKGAVGSGNGF